jgi:outer membrane protein assembly factor BamB
MGRSFHQNAQVGAAMKGSIADIIFVSFSTAVISTSSFGLYREYTNKIQVKDLKKIGTLSFKKQAAQRKYSSQVVWEGIEQNSEVFNNDSIRTQEASEAIVHLLDGTEIGLEENSMILFSQSKNSININFEQGSISAKRSGNEGSVPISIQSKDALVTIANSDVKLSKNENEDLNLTVATGSAKLSTAKGDTFIAQDQMLTLFGATQETKVDKIPFKLIAPEDNKYIINTDQSTTVSFEWENSDKSVYYLETADDRGFTRNMKSVQTASGKLSLTLQPGSLFWRLKAFNRETKKDDYSDIRKILVVKDSPVSILYPYSGETISFESTRPIINFRWNKNDIASAYSLEISKDENFASFIHSSQTQMTEKALDNLSEGVYFWRIRTRASIPGMPNYSITSAVNRFTVSKETKSLPPAVLSPADNVKLSVSAYRQNGITFGWKPNAEQRQYSVTVSDNRNFSTVLESISVSGNFAQLKKDLPSGNYFWRVREESGTRNSPYSDVRQFSIINVFTLTLNEPVNKFTKNLSENEKNAAIQFKWSQAPSNPRYQIEISRDASFLTVIKRTITAENTYTDNFSPGQYYWKIKLLDENRNEISSTPVSYFAVNEFIKPLPPVVTKPVVPAGTPTPAGTGVEKPVLSEQKKITKKPATVHISANSDKAVISINNKTIGTRTALYEAKADVEFTVNVKAEGFKEFSLKLKLKEGTVKDLNVKLINEKGLDRIRWSSGMQNSVLTKPLLINGMIIIGTENKNLAAMNRNGTVLWKTNLDGIMKSTPVVFKDRIYTVDVEGNLYAILYSSGKIIWKKKMFGPLLYGSQPAVTDDRIFTGNIYGMVEVFDHKGNQVDEFEVEEGIYSSITYNSKTLYIATDESTIMAIDTKRGKNIWKKEISGRVIASSPRIFGDTLYVGDYTGKLYAFSANKGKLLWTFPTKGPIFSTPIQFENLIIFASDDTSVYAVNQKTGQLAWNFSTKDKITYYPEINNKKLYISSGNGLFVIKPENGELIWKYTFNSDINTSVSADGNEVFVGLKNGSVVSLRNSLFEK